MIISGTEIRRRREALGLSQSGLSELSNVPQHLLSAFELEKAMLSDEQVVMLRSTLENKTAVGALATRKKRYRAHVYQPVEHDPVRVARHVQTPGNAQYVAMLNALEASRVAHVTHSGTAISLFSGCGGFSLGLGWAGFKIAGLVEINPALQRIYKENFPETAVLGDDITLISDDALRNIAKSVRSVDVLIGGPPCQGFSLAGKRDVSDPRNALFRHYLRFVDAFRPAAAIMENVRLLTSMKTEDGGRVADAILEEFGRHGYQVSAFEINAKDYGVPQHRERVLFVAIRNDIGIVPSLPKPAFAIDGGRNLDLFHGTHSYRTFADACSDLPFLESGERSQIPLHEAVSHPAHVIDWLWDVKEGASAHENSDVTKRPPSGYNTTYKRQIWNEPASTLQTTFGMISGCRNVHPIATRSLTIREAARVQSFPDSFRFTGTLQAIRTGLGNAVPPLLAYEIGRYIKSALRIP